jgi:nicotinate-nucleotide adenylyltransferase
VTPRGLARIGVLGGSFDPVHCGHLILAEAAVTHLRLDRLLLLPAGRPAHKRRRTLAPAADRIAMLRLAARGNPRLQVSTREADRPGVTFTVRTLEALAAEEPADWFFVMGEDSLREFGTWREPARILELARLAVVRREGTPRATVRASLRRRVVFVPMPSVGISSSEIRRRVARGRSVRYWVPDSVLSYMDRHGLYRSGRTRRA